jgi:hypothetical protein
MTAYCQAQARNYYYFDTHAFVELLQARERADKEAAEQKVVQTSFYAPQLYQFQTVGVFGTMFGMQRGEHAILLFRPRSLEELRMAEWREAFWPTTKVGRTALDIETKRLKAKEDLEKTTRWRMKTWPRRMGQRMGRHIQHLLAHHTFAQKEVTTPYSPFWELTNRPEPWETRVPEVVQALEAEAAEKAERKKVAKDKAQTAAGKKKNPGENPTMGAKQSSPEQQSSERNASSKPPGKSSRVRWPWRTE